MATTYVTLDAQTSTVLVPAVEGKIIRLLELRVGGSVIITLFSNLTQLLPALRTGSTGNIHHIHRTEPIVCARGEPLVAGNGLAAPSDIWISYDIVE